MKLSTMILLALIIMYQFIAVSSDCIKLKTSETSKTYAGSQTGCLDFVTLNTTYTDSEGNLRHGPIHVLASGARSFDTISSIMTICLICATAYLAFF